MKKIFLLFTCLLTVALFAAEPENYIPDQSQQVLRMDARRMIQMPWLRNILNSADERCREVLLFLDELKKHGIEPEEFFAGEVWCAKIGANDKSYVILLKTALPEVKFAEFFNERKANNKNVELNISTLAGHTIYTAKYASTYNAAAQSPFLTVYLAKDVIAIMPYGENSGTVLTSLEQGGNNPAVKIIDRKSLSAMYGRNISRKEKIRWIDAKIDLTGAEQRDVVAEIILGFKNAKTAMRKSMEFQFLLPGLLGLLFANDQMLMNRLMSCWQIFPDQEKIIIKISLNKAVQDKISSYIADPANISRINGNQVDSSVNMTP